MLPVSIDVQCCIVGDTKRLIIPLCRILCCETCFFICKEILYYEDISCFFFLIGKKRDKHLEFLSSGGVWPHKDAVRPAQKSDLLLLQI